MNSLPVVFLHGFLGGPGDWTPVREALGLDLRSRAPTLPGHGGDAAPDVESFLSAQAACGPCRVVGYSMGGRLALLWALRHPAQVRSLVLVSASPGLEDEEVRSARRARDADWAALLRAGNREAFLRSWYAQPVFAALRAKPALLAEVQGRRALTPLPALAVALERMSPGHQPALWGRLGELGMPILHVAGAEDTDYVEIARRAAELSPRASMVRVPESGHAVMEEQPVQLAAVLRNWWARVESRAG